VLHAIKPYNERYDVAKWLESDADEQLIIKIPFTGSVKLKVDSGARNAVFSTGRMCCLKIECVLY
jgi:hypothetical protein